VVLQLVCKVGGWFDLPASFPIPLFIPTLYSPIPSLILYSHSPKPSGGLCTYGMWWWMVVEEKRLEVAARPSRAITSRTYGVFNSIPVYLPHSTIQKLFKLLKIFRYILDTYQNGSRILSRAINVVSRYYGEKA
jgi:hypothetical protein